MTIMNGLILSAVSAASDDRVSTTRLDSQYNDDLKKEVHALKMKIAAVSWC